MNWAALTPSRCASRSTSVHSDSAKQTVVARIGMAGAYQRRRIRSRGVSRTEPIVAAGIGNGASRGTWSVMKTSLRTDHTTEGDITTLAVKGELDEGSC